MYGIYVHNDGAYSYARALVKGLKTIETRTRDVFKHIAWWGQKLAVIETGNGEPTIVGYVILNPGYPVKAELFHNYDAQHHVPAGSKYDTGEQGKWFYEVTWCEELDEPRPLPENRINHGRSYTEFEF